MVATKKPWLREECGWILHSACQTLKDGNWSTNHVRTLLEKWCQAGLAKTPEGVAVWLRAREDFPGVDLPSNVWQDGNPLHTKDMSKLARVLKESPVGEGSQEPDGDVSQKGSWSSKLHFVWTVIFNKLANLEPVPSNVDTSKTVSFGRFWQEAVDGGFFWVF